MKGGTSFHVFDKESLNYTWQKGKIYTFDLNSENLDFCLLTYGLIDEGAPLRVTLIVIHSDIIILHHDIKSRIL